MVDDTLSGWPDVRVDVIEPHVNLGAYQNLETRGLTLLRGGTVEGSVVSAEVLCDWEAFRDTTSVGRLKHWEPARD